VNTPAPKNVKLASQMPHVFHDKTDLQIHNAVLAGIVARLAISGAGYRFKIHERPAFFPSF
jgi:hypothetical protein